MTSRLGTGKTITFFYSVSASQRAEDQKATHQVDNFRSSNYLLTINEKTKKLGNLWF